jgi:hypothetical protein
MSANRIVAVLTPLVFAPAAGAICAFLAKQGLKVDENEVQQVFIAGAAIALVPAVQWLHGWQKYETRQADAEQAIALANAGTAPAAEDTAFDASTENGGGTFDTLDDLDGFDGDAFADLDPIATEG